MKNIILLLSMLVSFVLTDIIKAEPVKLTFDVFGKSTTVMVEIEGADDRYVRFKPDGKGFPIASLDKESMIRLISELGRQLKASKPEMKKTLKIGTPAGTTIEFRYELSFEVTNTTKYFLATMYPRLLAYDKNGEFIGSDFAIKQNFRVDQKTVFEFDITDCRVEEIGSVKLEWQYLWHEDSKGDAYDISKVFTPKAVNFPKAKTK